MFTTIKGTKINPVDYIRDYISTHDHIQIFVGCDSQNTKEATTYVTAIVLYSPVNGGHIGQHGIDGRLAHFGRCRVVNINSHK